MRRKYESPGIEILKFKYALSICAGQASDVGENLNPDTDDDFKDEIGDDDPFGNG